MDSIYPLFCLCISSLVCLLSCTFVHVTKEPFLSTAWQYKYDPSTGVAAMKNSYRPTPNDTCHVYKLTDEQRQDIHTMAGEFKIEIMMYQAVLTQHGETMTAQELNKTSFYIWRYCSHQLKFMKYNFYT
ncbi:uncharacterized protein LOC134271430 [Saccostrea cucullata]|uniref:uncharacterized protein LOC134271430 n=1 Tax=Saccostrea cuccullata TaxID=36930 RepID=UPI002ED3FE20